MIDSKNFTIYSNKDYTEEKVPSKSVSDPNSPTKRKRLRIVGIEICLKSFS